MARPVAGVPEGQARSVVLSAIWRARWVVLGAVLVAGVGGYAASASQPSVYTAQSRAVLSANAPFTPLSGQSYNDPARYISNQVALITTVPVLNLAVERLGEDLTATELAAGIEVEPSGADDVIAVHASAPTGEAAADRANAVLAAYQQYVVQQVSRTVAAATGATTDPAVVDQVRTEAAVYGDGVLLVEEASAPGDPASPSPARDALLLAVVAALLGIGLALWRRAPARDNSAPVDAAGARVLGSVPVSSARRSPGRVTEPEQFALVLVSLQYARQGLPGPVLITGAGRSSGAPGLAHGLAVTAAARGQKVLLVAADLDDAELLDHLRVPGRPRPLDALTDGAEVSECLAPVPGAPGLSLAVLSGTALPAQGAGGELAQLAAEYDLVLLQTAPVTDDPLAFSLVGHAGAVVAAVGVKDTADRIASVRARTDAAGRPLIGIVSTRPARGKRAPAAGAASAPVRKSPAPPAKTSTPVPAGDGSSALSRPS
ncbi:hypothetical protein [Modestobacter sp. SYSU DS0657]